MTEQDQIKETILSILENSLCRTSQELLQGATYQNSLLQVVLKELVKEGRVVILEYAGTSLYAIAGRVVATNKGAPAVSATHVHVSVMKQKPVETMGLSYSEPLCKMNHAVGMNRIIALKRLRDRLMEDYHPLLNLVIRDYEALLNIDEE